MKFTSINIPKPKHIVAYGTLREGFYNFNRFNLTKLKTTKIKGFKLYDLGPFPAVVRASQDDEITVDILQCSEYTADSITRMEEGAGYQTETIEVDNLSCLIYTYQPNQVTNKKLIENGDYRSVSFK